MNLVEGIVLEIRIEEVLDAESGWVRFRSGGTSARGCWVGPGEVPVGRDLHVELEVPEEGIISVRPVSGPVRHAVAEDGDVVVIVGCVERVDVDGVISARVGDDIVLLEGVGPLAGAVEGTYVELRVRELKLYPVNL
ncbi:hypothetical protein ABTZ99_17690 [Actinosynnema sp. NPDC002837]